ncbi:putative Ig domain-containing protein [Rathayibacter sp. YIM 133350]|uniref:putative Ig domain-containing protein n=1 Tax=Rathayibacter sp. YIM 133350 TaxID=3131992 RepID=UPI00307DB31E
MKRTLITAASASALLVALAVVPPAYADVPAPATTTPAASTTLTGRAADIAVSADGSTAYVSHYEDGRVDVVDLATHSVASTLNLAVGREDNLRYQALFVRLSADGSLLYVFGNLGGGYFAVVDTTTLAVTSEHFDVDAYPLDLVVNPAGGDVYVLNDYGAGIDSYDPVTLQPVGSVAIPGGGTPGHPDIPTTGTVSPDGATLYVAQVGTSASIVKYDIASASVIGEASGGSTYNLSLSRDGSLLLDRMQGGLILLDPADLHAISTPTVPQWPADSAFSPDSTEITSVGWDPVGEQTPVAYVIDTDSGQVLSQFSVEGWAPSHVAYRPDGLELLVSSQSTLLFFRSAIIGETDAPQATVGEHYAFDPALANTTSSEVTGGSLPPGLSLQHGVITGTPTEAGTFTATLSAHGLFGPAATADVTVVVQAAAEHHPPFVSIVLGILRAIWAWLHGHHPGA